MCYIIRQKNSLREMITRLKVSGYYCQVKKTFIQISFEQKDVLYLLKC